MNPDDERKIWMSGIEWVEQHNLKLPHMGREPSIVDRKKFYMHVYTEFGAMYCISHLGELSSLNLQYINT